MTTISERGQIVIPKYFRELLGWESETPVRFSVQDNRLVMERRLSIKDELEEFARECNVDLKGMVDFDEVYDESRRKKYAKLGFRY